MFKMLWQICRLFFLCAPNRQKINVNAQSICKLHFGILNSRIIDENKLIMRQPGLSMKDVLDIFSPAKRWSWKKCLQRFPSIPSNHPTYTFWAFNPFYGDLKQPKQTKAYQCRQRQTQADQGRPRQTTADQGKQVDESRWKWMNVDESGWKWMKVDKIG